MAGRSYNLKKMWLIAFSSLLAVAGLGLESWSQGNPPPDQEEIDQRFERLPVSQKLSFRAHMRQGLELLLIYQVERAEAEFSRSLEIVPDHPEALFHRGRIALRKKETAEAARLLTRAVQVNPDILAAHSILLSLYGPDGPLADPATAELHRAEIGRICGELGDFDRKIEEWIRTGQGADPKRSLLARSQELLATPESPITRYAQAYALREGALISPQAGLDHSLKADQAFHRLIDDYPGLVGILIDHGRWLLMTQIRFDLVDDPNLPPMDSSITLDIAQVYFERAFDASPLDSQAAHQALLHLGHVARDMGDFDRAVQLYRIVAEQPGASTSVQWQAHFNLGVVHLRLDDRAAALPEFTLSEQINSDPIIRWYQHISGGPQLTLRPEPVTEEHRRTLKFVDVAKQLGVDKYDGAGPSAWGDVDNDGDLDLYVSGCDTFSILYRNDGDHFTDISREAGLENIASGFSSTFADYDNDGDVDLYVGRNGWSGPAANSLYRNRGNGTFEDVTQQAGVGHPGSTFVHGWADFDRDGWLDLYMANGITKDGSVNCLYHNNGDGTFTDVTLEVGLGERPGIQTIGFGIGDYNRDGWPDIFVNSWGSRNRLYRNQGNGKFADVATFAGVDGRRFPASGYLGFINDFDNDTWPDILLTKLCPSFGMTIEGMLEGFKPTRLTNLYTSKLFRSKGDGWTFEDVSEASGLIYAHGSMGANVADVNNDGNLDFYLGTGDPWLPRMESNALYINEGNARFVDLTRYTGLGHLGKGHGITFADFDSDGDIDLYAPQGGFVHGDLWNNALYRNELGNRNNWLQVLLVGTRSNRMGVGAQLTVRSGDSSLYLEKTAGGAFGSSSTPHVHFGLGQRTRIDSLEIWWPSGEETTYRDIPINSFIQITEGSPEIKRITPAESGGPGQN
ncbi:MAG: VCBS repeat-containing protein [Acidobacteriota bacterium]|nr:MAG: VCBS repeat-containing protein [Acidobacteriota bacterium]